MFDMFSKLGEIKEKASKVKSELEQKQISGSDSQKAVEVKSNGKKDILSISLNENFSTMSKEQQEKALLEAIQSALEEGEKHAISVFKGILPNIPGLNLF